MRIMTFPLLIHREETKPVTLKNCSVVIDGQNYLHNVYEDSKIPFIFGCEADKYARYLRNRFKMFKQANVKCYIVLKGGDMNIEKKIKKFQHLTVSVESDIEFVPPILIKDVITQVLDEMHMDYAVCVAESKDDCVALAQRLNCPVISFDIEYCFKKALYVPSLSLKSNGGTNSIQCNQYKLQDFRRNHSLTEEKVALFGALCDINLFPSNSFDSLFQTWGVLNVNLYIQNKNLIKWMSENSEEKARKDISKVLSSDDDRNKFWEYYDNVLTNMRKDEPGCATNLLFDSKLTIVRQDPKWFEKGVAAKHISPLYVNLCKWKVIDGSRDVEDKNSRDSLLLSADIIKYAYNLLTNYKKDKIKMYQDADNFTEIDTEDSNIRKPSYNCKVSVFENGWSIVKRLKLFEHFLSENKISTEVLGNVPVEATALFVALVYFARKKELESVDVWKEVYAILLSYVMLNVVFDKEDSYKKKTYNINQEDCKKAESVTAMYFKCDTNEARRIFDGKALKRLVEFQYCMQHINYLNILCGSPYKPTRYHRTYNGTFVFKIFSDMRDKDKDVFINELFLVAPSVLAFIKELINVYRQLLTTE